jgi:hypothetical protein
MCVTHGIIRSILGPDASYFAQHDPHVPLLVIVPSCGLSRLPLAPGTIVLAQAL